MAVVYIDVLFAVNFIINILLIEASGVICSAKTVWYRSLLSSAFGAFYSVLIFFPDLEILYTFVTKIAFSGFMVICAFKIGSLKQFFSLWGAFYIVSFVFGGCIVAIMSISDIGQKTSAVYSNGVVYFDLPWQYLFLGTLISYLLIIIIGRVRRKRECRTETKDVSIYVNGQCVKLDAIIDTGNSLFDPITGEPVAVCESEALCALLGSGDEPIIEKMAQKGLRVRLVPFSSVGKTNGIMPGFKPDMVKVDGKEAEGCVICVCENRLSNTREYRALLNPQLIK